MKPGTKIRYKDINLENFRGVILEKPLPEPFDSPKFVYVMWNNYPFPTIEWIENLTNI